MSTKNRERRENNRKRRQTLQRIQRDPGPEIKQFLRKEVHYACPVPKCGRPLLEWHHFDPKWEERPHHNPEGMIALCTSCHPKADRGTWTKEELRSFKQNPAPLGLIRETFGWSERSVIYRLGGSYAIDNGGVLAINNRRILWDSRSADGRLLFSLDLLGETGNCLLQVRENCLSVDTLNIFDVSINSGATHLKLWLGERKPGIELQFRRLAIEAFRKNMVDARGNSRSTEYLLDYAFNNCRDSDGKVTIVDIAQARLYGPAGRLVQITNTKISVDTNKFISCDLIKTGGYGFFC